MAEKKGTIIGKLFIVLFLFIFISIPLLASAFFIKTIIAVGFYFQEVGSILVALGVVISLLMFLVPFFPIYLIIHYMQTRFGEIFQIQQKYRIFVKITFYLIFFVLYTLYFNQLMSDFDEILQINPIVDYITFIVLFVIDILCEKIYVLLKKKYFTKKPQAKATS